MSNLTESFKNENLTAEEMKEAALLLALAYTDLNGLVAHPANTLSPQQIEQQMNLLEEALASLSSQLSHALENDPNSILPETVAYFGQILTPMTGLETTLSENPDTAAIAAGLPLTMDKLMELMASLPGKFDHEVIKFMKYLKYLPYMRCFKHFSSYFF